MWKPIIDEVGNLEYVDHEYLEENKLLKREYQISLFIEAANENTLLVLPTGLGKTLVALLLAVNRLAKFPSHKILFLAPTKPLVEQHFASFADFLNLEEEKFQILTGSVSPDDRETAYDDAQIFFATPQVIRNDILRGLLSLESVSLIIFDECHRATGKYSYVFIANAYKERGENPLILGMSASPGKDKETIEEVMQNLHLTNVAIRTEHDPDVRPYVHKVHEEWIDVDLPEQMEEVNKILTDLLSDIQEKLDEHGFIEYKNSNLSKTQILSITKKLDYKINKTREQDELIPLFYLKKVVANAMRISHMNDLLESQGIKPLLDYFDDNYDQIKENKASKSAQELFQSPIMTDIYQTLSECSLNQINHPKMDVLADLCETQINRSPESRILVFAQYRDTINQLVKHLKKIPALRPHRFVGQAKKKTRKGLTQKEQVELLEEFKKGTYNVLIATSVAEEGLDIAECDLVIFFDIIPSAVRSIQRRGRTGRKKEGKVIFLKTKGTKEDAFYWIERRREKNIQNVLREMQRGKKARIQRTPKRKSSSQKTKSLMEFASNTPAKSPSDQKKSRNETKATESSQKTKSLMEFASTAEIPQTSNQNKQVPKYNQDSTNQSADDDLNELLEDFRQEGLKYLEKNANLEFEDTSQHSPKEDEPAPLQEQNTVNEKRIEIKVDNRELRADVIKYLYEWEIQTTFDNLPVGDYVVSNRCGVERKSLEDYVSSLKDGRLFDELLRLRQQFEIPILILEGSIVDIAGIDKNAFLGSLSAIILKFQITVLMAENERMTAEFLESLAKKEQITNKKSSSVVFKKLPQSYKGKLETILSIFPKLNVSRARALLNHFGSLKTIFTATRAELEEVPSIGKKIAEELETILTRDYRSSL